MSETITQKQLEQTLDRYQSVILEAVNSKFNELKEGQNKLEDSINKLTDTIVEGEK